MAEHETRGPSINDVVQGIIESIVELKKELVARGNLIAQLKAEIAQLKKESSDGDSEKQS